MILSMPCVTLESKFGDLAVPEKKNQVEGYMKQKKKN